MMIIKNKPDNPSVSNGPAQKKELEESLGRNGLSLLLLNTTYPVLANSVDPDQLASEEAS